MRFQAVFIVNIISMIISWGVGLYLAYRGYGVWALLLHYISNKLLIFFLYIFCANHFFSIGFSSYIFIVLLKYGSKLLLSNLIITLYDEFRGLVIGKRYSTEELGYYNRGKQFPMAIISSISTAVQNVVFSVYSKEQDDLEYINRMHAKVTNITSFVVFPIAVGLAIVAEPLVHFVLTDKWLGCVPYIYIFCAFYIMWPLRETCQQTIASLGRSDLYLKVEIIGKLIGIIILLCTFWISPYAIGIGLIIDGLFSTIINMLVMGKLTSFKIKDQIAAIIKNLIVSVLMFIIVFPIKYLISNQLILLLAQVLIGVLVYAVLSFFINKQTTKLFLSVFRRRRNA